MRKGLAVLARFLDAAEPDARLPVVLCLPVKLEESGHARMVDFPHQCAVLYDLLDGWCAHKRAGTYTGCLAHNMHNRPERASCDGGTREL